MDPIKNKSFFLSLNPSFGYKEDGTPASQFTWGIMTNPRLVKKDETGVVIGFLDEDQKNSDNRSVELQLMRLFACNIVRDILLEDGTIDQNTFTDSLKFNLRPDIKEFVAKVVDNLGQEIISEINYQIDPIKPTKSKFDSLSLIPKQEQTIQNIENGQERTETNE